MGDSKAGSGDILNLGMGGLATGAWPNQNTRPATHGNRLRMRPRHSTMLDFRLSVDRISSEPKWSWGKMAWRGLPPFRFDRTWDRGNGKNLCRHCPSIQPDYPLR
jgi:hypothetical protein